MNESVPSRFSDNNGIKSIMNVPKDYEEFFVLLKKEKVKFLIVGAYALAYHGYPRFTGDIDIFISNEPPNARRALSAIEKFGFQGIGITVEDLLKPDSILQLGNPPLRIDIITDIDGVSFTSAWKNRVRGIFGKQNVWYISKKDLVKNKKATGRTQDKFDLEMLKRK